MKITFCVILAFLFVSCSPKSIESSAKTRVFNTNFDELFSAVLTYSNSNSYPILVADKNSGIINTDFCPLDMSKSLYTRGERNKISFTLKTISANSTKIFAQYSIISGLPEEYDIINKSTYDSLFDSIEQYIK